MKGTGSLLSVLAKKLTAPFAFAVIVIILIAAYGGQIPEPYTVLVYSLGLGIPIIWALVEIIKTINKNKLTGQNDMRLDHANHNIVTKGNKNNINYIVNEYRQSNPDASETEKEIENQLKGYINWVETSFRWITFRGIERGGSQVVQLSLDDIYVPLEAECLIGYDKATSTKDDQNIFHNLEQPKTSKDIRLDQVFSLGQFIIITSKPGGGKTTILQHIAWTLAHSLQSGDAEVARKKLGLDLPLPLPIYIPISLYASYLRNLPKSSTAEEKTLAAFVSSYLFQRQQGRLRLPPNFFVDLIQKGKDVILLLDGLDEVPTESERAKIRQAIEGLVAGSNHLRVVVTSRTTAYRGSAVFGKSFQYVHVLPLTSDDVKKIVSRACYFIYEKDRSEADKQAKELMKGIATLEANRRQWLGEEAEPLVDTPLMIRMLLIVHYNNRKLPDQRADLYRSAVDAMLKPEYNLDQDVAEEIAHFVAGGLEVNRDMLQHLAFHMHRQGRDQGREVSEEAIGSIMGNEPTYVAYVNELISQTRQRGTLLEEHDNSYRFIHLSFQEFLVGRFLVEVLRDPEKIASFLEEDPVLDVWWREPILLGIGYLDLTSPASARRLLLRLARDRNENKGNAQSFDTALASAELAVSAYRECKNQSSDLYDILKKHLQDLHKVSIKEKWTPSLLAGIAFALDSMDYIPGDLYELLYVKNLKLHMAKYPVTNIQYERFIKAVDFSDKELWNDFPQFTEAGKPMRTLGEAGWEWLQSALKDPEFSPDGKVVWPRKWRDSRFGIVRRTVPVVRVSWYEANAYCKWVSRHWESLEENRKNHGLQAKKVRLPTEMEWTKAAGGKKPKDRYPWEKDVNTPTTEIIRYANVEESSIGCTTPVWMYSLGANVPSGIMDMTGNAWEWQANYYSDNLQRRAVKGGAWDYEAGRAKVYYRENNPPSDIGFRIVAES